MSYNLHFWKYKDGVRLNHQKVCKRLSAGQAVEGLELIPIPEIISAIETAFKVGWDRPDKETWEGGDRGVFQVFTTPQFFRFDLYGLEAGDIERLLEIGKTFDCPMYDPQKGKRYDDGSEPEV